MDGALHHGNGARLLNAILPAGYGGPDRGLVPLERLVGEDRRCEERYDDGSGNKVETGGISDKRGDNTHDVTSLRYMPYPN